MYVTMYPRMPELTHFPCPQCKTVLEVPSAMIGQIGQCHTCGAHVQVPQPAQRVDASRVRLDPINLAIGFLGGLALCLVGWMVLRALSQKPTEPEQSATQGAESRKRQMPSSAANEREAKPPTKPAVREQPDRPRKPADRPAPGKPIPAAPKPVKPRPRRLSAAEYLAKHLKLSDVESVKESSKLGDKRAGVYFTLTNTGDRRIGIVYVRITLHDARGRPRSANHKTVVFMRPLGKGQAQRHHLQVTRRANWVEGRATVALTRLRFHDSAWRAPRKSTEVALDKSPTRERKAQAARLAAELKALKLQPGRASRDPAIVRGLKWLVAHQSPDGGWDVDGFARKCNCTGKGKLAYCDVGVTGLATLALVRSGKIAGAGDSLARAVRYLIQMQDGDGLLGIKSGKYLYNHAVGTLALVEAYRISGANPTLKRAASKAVGYLLAARNPGQAWRYHMRDGDNDISVSGWSAVALKTAQLSGLQFKTLAGALTEVLHWVDSVTDAGYGITGYRKRPPRGWQGATSARFVAEDIGVNTANSHAADHTPTAIAVAVRSLLRAKVPSGSAEAVCSVSPVWKLGGGREQCTINLYFWYWGALALHRQRADKRTKWRRDCRKALLRGQQRQGHATGSWDPVGALGFAGGRPYSTAMGVLVLLAWHGRVGAK